MIKRVDNGGQVKLVTNIRKPRKWRRFEYLLSNGQAYIDTKIPYDSTKSTYKIECKFSLPSNVGSYDAIFGAYTDENSKTLRIIRGNNNSIMWSYYNTRAGGGVCGRIETANSNIREVILTSTKTIVTENGTTTTYTHPAVNGNNTTSKFYLFCQGTSNGSISCWSKSRIYYFKLYDNDILIKHFVPAEYNGQYGMWDLVEDRFYKNSGAGSFTVGSEMKNYDEIYEVRKTSSLLPAGVELYDYILSSSTLYIDTEYNLNVGDEFDFTYMDVFNGSTKVTGSTENKGYGQGIGSNSSANYSGGGRISSSKIMMWINAANTSTNIKSADSTGKYKETLIISSSDVKIKFEEIGGNTYINTTINTSVHNTANLYFFKDSATSFAYPGVKKFFNSTIKHNGILVRNFLPCTYLGEPGLWDTVENKFYRNQGTGTFALGNKIILVEREYLQGSGSSTYINTNYYPNVNTKFIYKVSNPSSGSCTDGEINGTSATGHNFYIGDTLYAFDNTVMSGLALRKTTPFVALIDKNGLYIDNVFVTRLTSYGSNWVSPRPFFLSALNRGSGIVYNTNKIYYCLFYENNQLVRDFIPVSYNGTPGLWDRVEWKFYGNAGTGSFILGPEKSSGIYPVSYLHDRTVYEEPDGSKWLRIAHHNNPGALRFTSTDSFTSYVHTSDNLWFDVSWCNTFTLWELMVKQKTISSAAEQKFRWVLNYNPMTATYANVARANVTYNTSSDYTTPIAKLGGLYKSTMGNSYLLCNNGTSGNWYGNVGGWTLYLNGMPGWNNTVVTTGYLDLYIRIA